MRARSIWAAPLLAAGLLWGAPAAAEEAVGGIALNQFDPAPAGGVFSAVQEPFIGGHLQPRLRVLFDHAIRPLVLSTESSTGDVVSRQTLMHVDAAVPLWDRLVIDLLVPIVLAQGGDNPTVNGSRVESPSSASLGDMRLGLRLRPFGSDDSPFQLAMSAYAYAPTGGDDIYAGDGGFRVAPNLLLGGRVNKVVWSLSFGGGFHTSDNPSTINYGVGMGILILDNFLQIGPEMYGSTPLNSSLIPVSSTSKVPRPGTTNMELMLSLRLKLFWGLSASLAAGPGLTDAIGTPSFRLVGGIGWAMPPKGNVIEASGAPADTDKDTIIDASDACPNTYGVFSEDPTRRGCPVLDRDEDGVPDPDDACPDQQGDKSPDKKQNGCPLDTDGDAVPDEADACPKEKGDASPDATRNGCPPAAIVAAVVDTDGDGVSDSVDACPQEKGPERADAASTGCPQFVRVKGKEITLLQPIAFITKGTKDTIDPASEPVLTEVRDVIAQHPELVKIEVQGYTDNVGNAQFNEKLSAARAALVRAWLVEHGAQADRLVSKGYGPSSPIADNKTAEGRKANRRVQIVVLEAKQP